jgi:hypothetical protein
METVLEISGTEQQQQVTPKNWPIPVQASNILKSFHSSLTMETARTSETSVDNYFTRQYIP